MAYSITRISQVTASRSSFLGEELFHSRSHIDEEGLAALAAFGPAYIRIFSMDRVLKSHPSTLLGLHTLHLRKLGLFLRLMSTLLFQYY